MFEDLPKSRKECNELGSRYYFTGKPCKNGHLDKRNKQGRCMTCLKESNAARDQSTGAKIGRPVGSKNKKGRKQGGRPAQKRRLEKRRDARLAAEIKRELKRIDKEQYIHDKEQEAIEDEKYVRVLAGNTVYYTDPCNGKLAILYESTDGFITHCFHKSIEHNYDLQRAEGKLERVYSDGTTTARRLPEGDVCQYTQEHGYHCIHCQKDKHENSLSLLYDYTEKKYIPSLGRRI